MITIIISLYYYKQTGINKYDWRHTDVIEYTQEDSK